MILSICFALILSDISSIKKKLTWFFYFILKKVIYVQYLQNYFIPFTSNQSFFVRDITIYNKHKFVFSCAKSKKRNT